MRLNEYNEGDFTAKPGTWEHYVACAAPWFFLWAQKQ